MNKRIPLEELKNRMINFIDKMNNNNPSWKFILILSKINLYYFTGTMQDGLLIIKRDSPPIFWVRRSFERAKEESLFENIKSISSLRELESKYKDMDSEILFLETNIVTLSLLKKLNKYLNFKETKSIDYTINSTRSVKSNYELDLLIKSGNIHQKVMEEKIPHMLKEGMSELELASKIFSTMLEEGHHGVARFSMFDTEISLGHIAFGESSLYPTYFNGPGGNFGLSPSMPFLGSRDRKLKKGDLIFIDVGCGYEGYHTDKTMTYVFGKPLPNDVVKIHNKCVDIQNQISQILVPGNTPGNIYKKIMGELDQDFLNNFMGYKNRKVKFLGHGVGLVIDEIPVIAESFREPLVKNMVLAIEPKIGISKIGMVGIENTFIINENSSICITGSNNGLIYID
ncbi:MAG: Xaa-Pro peptidase family protein [Clostridiales bacterium]